MTSDSKDTLSEFARSRSEEAFRKLVREHSPIVYGTALRKLGGNRAAAQDVTQEVFTLLARKASGLGPVVLGGWLYRQACRHSANHVRSESRRKRRESIAMQLQPDNSPSPAGALSEELDDALLALPETDRNALILRFFEGHEFRSLGSELGLSEEAARKRVTRALERLAGNLKRKGIAVGSVSLGTAMQGFGATQVPAAVVSAVSESALKAATAGGSTGLASLLKPVVAGVVASSLVAGSAMALRPPDHIQNRAGSASLPPAVTSGPRLSKVAERLPEEASLEQIIAEIRLVLSGPDNALTELRLKAAIGKIRIPQIPAFVALGDGAFKGEERIAIYQPLLRNWWQHDRAAAMDFILVMSERHKVYPNEFLARAFFSRWGSEDFASSVDWLFANWNHPVLQYPAFSEPLRDSLVKSAASDRFHRGDMEGLFRFIARLPEVKDRVTAFEPFAGQDSSHGIYVYSSDRKEHWKQVYRRIEALPDEAGRTELVRSFWRMIGEHCANEVGEIRKFIEPAEPFLASLGALQVTSVPSQEIENMAGGRTVRYELVTDMEARLENAVETGLAQGLSRDVVMEAVAETLRKQGSDDARKWLEENAREEDTDETLRTAVESAARYAGEVGRAMEKASAIRDEALRRRISRGAFRRLLSRSPSESLAWLESSTLPEDLKSELQTIASETP